MKKSEEIARKLKEKFYGPMGWSYRLDVAEIAEAIEEGIQHGHGEGQRLMQKRAASGARTFPWGDEVARLIEQLET